MRLVWSPLALDRALEAKAYIAAENPRAAERWAAGLVRAARKLKRYPKIGRVVPEIGLDEYREVRHGRYRVVYRISGDVISILTVRHYSRLIDLDELEQESE
jgi:plasmid stabilization system protein ParE